jgi:hypothetical protein
VLCDAAFWVGTTSIGRSRLPARGAVPLLAGADPFPSVCHDRWIVCDDPLLHRTRQFAQGPTELRKLVLDARRHLRIADALNEPVALKIAQRLREHLLRDTPHRTHQHARSNRALLEAAQNQDRPLAPDQVEQVAGGTIQVVRVGSFKHGLNYYHKVRTCQEYTVEPTMLDK